MYTYDACCRPSFGKRCNHWTMPIAHFLDHTHIGAGSLLRTIRLECRLKFVLHARTALRLGFRYFCPTPRQASRCGCHKSCLVPQVSSLLPGVLTAGTCQHSSFCALAFAYHFVAPARGIDRDTTFILLAFLLEKVVSKFLSEYEMTTRL